MIVGRSVGRPQTTEERKSKSPFHSLRVLSMWSEFVIHYGTEIVVCWWGAVLTLIQSTDHVLCLWPVKKPFSTIFYRLALTGGSSRASGAAAVINNNVFERWGWYSKFVFVEKLHPFPTMSYFAHFRSHSYLYSPRPMKSVGMIEKIKSMSLPLRFFQTQLNFRFLKTKTFLSASGAKRLLHRVKLKRS